MISCPSSCLPLIFNIYWPENKQHISSCSGNLQFSEMLAFPSIMKLFKIPVIDPSDKANRLPAAATRVHGQQTAELQRGPWKSQQLRIRKRKL
ncbi:uncharacterized protein LOC143246584 isoform X1 [Tachypleus tridentatus]|uniref:uncharacterized protein LOC143246584 isoform X1 n=1 Tax=Tachypleus tridentatus TaxID=6853 RepID=UPI003FD03C92